MPRTLDNHLAGVSATAPHPESYRPDLPLLTNEESVFAEEEFDRGYDEGFDDGKKRGRAAGWTSGYETGYTEGDHAATERIRRQSESKGA